MNDERDDGEAIAGQGGEPVEAEIVEAPVLGDGLDQDGLDEGTVEKGGPEEAPPLDLPDDPQEAVSVLITELMAARSAATEATDHWQRVAAEFENYRKRAQRDEDELVARSSERVAVQLLPVLDGLDAAMDLEAESESETKMLSGMQGTRELLLATLSREGVEPIEAIGMEFDPAVHEAVQVGEGSGRMMVVTELRRGYTLRGKVLRASLVVVGYESATEEGTETPA